VRTPPELIALTLSRESDAILNLIYDHLWKGLDFHVRIKYSKGAVILWGAWRLLTLL